MFNKIRFSDVRFFFSVCELSSLNCFKQTFPSLYAEWQTYGAWSLRFIPLWSCGTSTLRVLSCFTNIQRGDFVPSFCDQDGTSFSFCLEPLLPLRRSLDLLYSSYCNVTSSQGSRYWEKLCACVAVLGETIVAPVVGSSHEGLQTFTVVKGNLTALLLVILRYISWINQVMQPKSRLSLWIPKILPIQKTITNQVGLFDAHWENPQTPLKEHYIWD